MILFLTLTFLSSCQEKNQKETKNLEEQEKQNNTVDTSQILKETDREKEQPADLVEKSKKLLEQAKTSGLIAEELLEMIPAKGLRFVPYGYFNGDNPILKKDEIKNKWAKEDKIIWGTYDGSGETIELNLKEYFEKFIWDVNFLKADDIQLNKTRGTGNTIDNLKEVYPEADYVEFYMEGKNPDYGGMDWRLLRMVYAKNSDGKYELIAITHSQWTV